MVGSEKSLVLLSRRVDRAAEEKMRMDGFGKGREWSWGRGWEKPGRGVGRTQKRGWERFEQRL